MNGAPSSNADKAAFRRLPENELPQWQQNIALRAENPSGRAVRDHQVLFAGRMDFLRSNFLQVLDPHFLSRRRVKKRSMSPNER